jgi:hypothetical protein
MLEEIADHKAAASETKVKAARGHVFSRLFIFLILFLLYIRESGSGKMRQPDALASGDFSDRDTSNEPDLPPATQVEKTKRSTKYVPSILYALLGLLIYFSVLTGPPSRVKKRLARKHLNCNISPAPTTKYLPPHQSKKSSSLLSTSQLSNAIAMI